MPRQEVKMAVRDRCLKSAVVRINGKIMDLLNSEDQIIQVTKAEGKFHI
jgi:hypothetical protein